MAMTVCADLGRRRVADDRRLQAGGIDLDQREVRVVRLLDDRRRELAAVGQLDGQRLAAGHDVPVGQDVAVGRQDDARADAGRRDLAEAARREALRGDGHDRVADRRRRRRSARGRSVPSSAPRDRDRGRRARGVPGVRGASGPATSAAVPPAARTADRTAATTTEVGPRREPPVRRGAGRDRGRAVAGAMAGGGAGVQVDASVGAGAQAGRGVGAGRGRRGRLGGGRGVSGSGRARGRGRTSEAPIVLEVAGCCVCVHQAPRG